MIAPNKSHWRKGDISQTSAELKFPEIVFKDLNAFTNIKNFRDGDSGHLQAMLASFLQPGGLFVLRS